MFNYYICLSSSRVSRGVVIIIICVVVIALTGVPRAFKLAHTRPEVFHLQREDYSGPGLPSARSLQRSGPLRPPSEAPSPLV